MAEATVLVRRIAPEGVLERHKSNEGAEELDFAEPGDTVEVPDAELARGERLGTLAPASAKAASKAVKDAAKAEEQAEAEAAAETTETQPTGG